MRLSEAELEIMEQIWKLGWPVTAAELAGPLQQKGWKPHPAHLSGPDGGQGSIEGGKAGQTKCVYRLCEQ